MVLPRALANFNRHVTNVGANRFAGHLPPFAIVEHRGRKSGRVYRTPVMVFQDGSTYRIALTYGRDVDWVKNIVSAGGFALETKGHTVELTAPTVEHDPSISWAPVGVRQVLQTLSVSYYVEARAVA